MAGAAIGARELLFSAKGHLPNKGALSLLAGQVLRQDGYLREESVTGGQKPEPQGHREIKPAVVIVETPVAVSAAIACSPSPAAITDVCHREDDVYKAGERRNNQLVMELQNLVKILDGLIMDGK